MPRVPDGTDERHYPDCDPGLRAYRTSGGRAVSMVRYMRPGSVERLVCDRPMLMVSRCCGKTWAMRCGAHRLDDCAPCSSRYRRALERKVVEGLHRSKAPYRYLLTVTAPGDPGHSRWVPGKAGKHGVCGCDKGVSLGDWNPAAGECWNRLRGALRRLEPSLAFFRVAELQKRGAIHHHNVLLSDGPLDVLEVQALALEAGYGCVIDFRPLLGSDVAKYLTKYVTKDLGKRSDAPWSMVDTGTGEVVQGPANYRRHSSSLNWGITLKAIRSANLAAWRLSVAARADDREPSLVGTGQADRLSGAEIASPDPTPD